MEAQQSPR